MPPDASSSQGDGLLATGELLPLARAGDAAAREELFARFTPYLHRLLHARLPQHAHGLLDTDDLVQQVYAQVLPRLESFEYRGPGSFWGYLRQIGLNQVKEITRRQASSTLRPRSDGTATGAVDPRAGPAAELVTKERVFAFEKALGCLSEMHRQAVLMRMELQLPYEAVAAECGFPTAEAARMAICRAIEKIVQRMSHDGLGEEED